ncbi:MAG: NADH-quinone oxidoreductase subunit N [Thermomicrobium sp.]|nr:NADH-quinone oxidoreductase subunit N [Thermomicrobium sp.]MDW7982469.1 NADH-quinone oxidoreductase subunit N [Thermomicrobium sp.]
MPLRLVAPEWSLLVPPLLVLVTIVIVLAVDFISPRVAQRSSLAIALIGQILALVSLVTVDWGRGATTFGVSYRADWFTLLVALVALTAGILSVLIAAGYTESGLEPGTGQAEYLALLLFSVLGTMIVGAAGDFIVLLLGLEMSAVAVYALTAFARRRLTSIEGALKYFLLGAFASAILIYGLAWIYGLTGSIVLSDIAATLRTVVTPGQPVDPALLLALLLLAVGLGFKVAAVPFHMWTPDAYQGAPTPVSAYMSVVPKVAGFAAVARVLVQGLQPLNEQWESLLAILALVTMIYGNVVAIAQRDLKRMLGYSAIGHTGYMLAGLAAFTTGQAGDRSVGSVLFYLFAYAFMNIGAFGVIAWLQERGLGTTLDDIAGLASRAPLTALTMTIFMLSLMGMPPLLGFYAKYYVILALIEAGQLWLAVAIVVMSAVSAFYYLRVVTQMYFQEPGGTWRPVRTPMLGLGLAVMAVTTLALGLVSGPLLDLAQRWPIAFA